MLNKIEPLIERAPPVFARLEANTAPPVISNGTAPPDALAAEIAPPDAFASFSLNEPPRILTFALPLKTAPPLPALFPVRLTPSRVSEPPSPLNATAPPDAAASFLLSKPLLTVTAAFPDAKTAPPLSALFSARVTLSRESALPSPLSATAPPFACAEFLLSKPRVTVTVPPDAKTAPPSRPALFPESAAPSRESVLPSPLSATAPPFACAKFASAAASPPTTAPPSMLMRAFTAPSASAKTAPPSRPALLPLTAMLLRMRLPPCAKNAPPESAASQSCAKPPFCVNRAFFSIYAAPP